MSQPVALSRRLGQLVAPLLLAGCVLGPNYRRPLLEAAAGYGAAAIPAPGTGAPGLVSGADVPADWWSVFRCAVLDALVAQALKNSPTIPAAEAALRAAHEQALAQRGAFFPTISASVQPSRQHTAEVLASPLASNETLYNLTTAQVSITYAPDLFGANRRAVESLTAQADQQRFQLEAARLTLASNVVVAAIQDALLRAEIDQTQALIGAQRTVVASFERQLTTGQASSGDLAAQQALLAQAEATLPSLEKAYQVNRDLLAALVGRTPGEPVDVRFTLADLIMPASAPLSVPARLVEQRPDVRIAEAQLHAASAQVGVAEAARWPSLEIAGAAGGTAVSLVPQFGPDFNFWSLAATLTQPIFQGGALQHKQRAAEAAYDQAAAQYRATVVGAFQNTADVLHALSTDSQGLRAAEAAATATRKSLDIARRQFAVGETGVQTVLTAEQADHQAALAFVQARANRLDDVAALFQALGGGWWNRPGTA
jgi:NodT family efflux transporter outer membrane factor (OMF) lipoprotein